MIFRKYRPLILKICLVAMVVLIASAGADVWSAGAKKPAESQKGKIPFPRPESHIGGWNENHGASANLDLNAGGQDGRSCLACHERNDCITCHNTQMPRNHNNFWRTRGHGLMAEGNRDRCLTCHRQDYCVRCHNETAPRSHVGNWAVRHCTWCHFSSGIVPADNCAVCHRIAPHTSASTGHTIGPQVTCIKAGCHQ